MSSWKEMPPDEKAPPDRILDEGEVRRIRRLLAGQLTLLYAAPERVGTPRFLGLLDTLHALAAPAAGGELPRLLAGGLTFQIDLQRPPQAKRTKPLGPGLRIHQHAADIGMDEQRVGLFLRLLGAGERAALATPSP